ncbi:MAG TPA: hypothetical protein VFE01_01405 [Terracidiphilus sp.]|jgi:hypothetical protein|nr:hypothetical protein [Terracidiphilus sp.]
MAAIQPGRIVYPLILFTALAARVASPAGAAAQPWRPEAGIATSRQMKIGGGTVQVDFANGPTLDLPNDAILKHIQMAASAVIAYYGRFPVARARILVVPVEGGGHREAIQGTTWGGVDGYQGFTRLRIAQHATAADLKDDWVTTHELVHMAFPSMPDDQHWIEEGQATYIEPPARVMTGELKAESVWSDMVHGMGQGEPRSGDEGIDHTHTWARTYWGGALFCFVADVEIRHETGNRKGLQDALRAVNAAGGTIEHDWPLDRALAIGDRATGTHVLTEMYAKWKDTPVKVDLPKLWSDLGIHSTADGGIEILPNAPLAKIRDAIVGQATQSPH